MMANGHKIWLLPLVVGTLLCCCMKCWGSEAELKALMTRMETMVLELRDEVELTYSYRCGITEGDCTASHYYDCFSEFPEPSCKSDGSWDVGACLEKNSNCGALWDFTTSGVRIPTEVGDDEPSDTEVIEAVCYTALIDDFLIEEYEKAQSTDDDLEFLGMFFGAWNGAFRIYPGRARTECGTYDPRYRPWYVAASSGPKNVIILIDTSGSMASFDRMALAKDAAKDVLSTLTVADYVAVIDFSSRARVLGESTDSGVKMLQATKENIAMLTAEVDSLEAEDATNFYAAFKLTFEVLDESFAAEASTNCETAILFLTDGTPTVGTGSSDDESDLYEQISSWNLDYGATVFSYSMGAGADLEIPKAISCQENGIWTYVPDGGNLRDKMAGFYTYYAAGMGTETNREFTAWVEPYEFATGGYYGTTVSAPVYDTSTSPWRFLGSVGIDFSVTYMEEVAGGADAYTTVLDALETASSAFCPQTNLSECNIQALRDAASYSSYGYVSTCDEQCSSFSSLTPEACMAASEYPTGADLWHNYNYKDKSYTARTCCGEINDAEDDTVYGSCLSAKGMSSTEIAAAVLVPVLFVCGIATGICYYQRYGKTSKRPGSCCNNGSAAAAAASSGARNSVVQQRPIPPTAPTSLQQQPGQAQMFGSSSAPPDLPVGIVAVPPSDHGTSHVPVAEAKAVDYYQPVDW